MTFQTLSRRNAYEYQFELQSSRANVAVTDCFLFYLSKKLLVLNYLKDTSIYKCIRFEKFI